MPALPPATIAPILTQTMAPALGVQPTMPPMHPPTQTEAPMIAQPQVTEALANQWMPLSQEEPTAPFPPAPTMPPTVQTAAPAPAVQETMAPMLPPTETEAPTNAPPLVTEAPANQWMPQLQEEQPAMAPMPPSVQVSPTAPPPALATSAPGAPALTPLP